MRWSEISSLSGLTLRLYTALHSWTGLLAGFALFVAFYAGAITVFQDDIRAWQDPSTRNVAQETPKDGERLLERVLVAHPEIKSRVSLQLPAETGGAYVAWWYDLKKKAWSNASLATLDGPEGGTRADLTSFVNAVHYSLGISAGGIYFMGVVSVLYGLALVSGVIIHLPRLTKDLLSLRPGKNLKKLWQDTHNLIGIVSLPFHLIFAITGAVFCLYALLLAGFNTLGFDGKLEPKVNMALDVIGEVQPANKAAPMLPLDVLLKKAEARAPGFEPTSLTILNYGDANAEMAVRGDSDRSLAPYGNVGIRMADGVITDVQAARERDANHATMSGMYSLHFGSYGAYMVKWLYFILGLGGAFLFYSGNLLWVESRRKARQNRQTTSSYRMAQATVGICIGTCIGISAAFVATQAAHAMGALDIPHWERVAAYSTFALAVVFAFVRPPAVAAIMLLRVAGVLTMLIPVANGVATGDHMLLTPWHGQWQVFSVDAMGLVLGAGFLWLAKLTRLRLLHGQSNSVWAMSAPPAREEQAVTNPA
ncbi:PepSY-associated TM helix domain-containing protein [Amantichitinum ursilacus]|uniref:PepSY-associated TM helix n=1 Tax=Amantichitinum ursilacus TaxID=857265 RepID=A0A0N1JU49_9NEIS|nr:PepSY-associated TM helix domain-containing protein [Amantichitinum ursilacus]KPC55454.1 hypothetical protein WG78_02315 [Amantichitinum ursilacus]